MLSLITGTNIFAFCSCVGVCVAYLYVRSSRASNGDDSDCRPAPSTSQEIGAHTRETYTLEFTSFEDNVAALGELLAVLDSDSPRERDDVRLLVAADMLSTTRLQLAGLERKKHPRTIDSKVRFACLHSRYTALLARISRVQRRSPGPPPQSLHCLQQARQELDHTLIEATTSPLYHQSLLNKRK